MMPCVEKLFVRYIFKDKDDPLDYVLQIHGWAKVSITDSDAGEYKEVIKIVPMVIEAGGNCLDSVMMNHGIDFKILTEAERIRLDIKQPHEHVK